jgi:predicted metal-dependent enzyme (double-stranded beta helix superfamily)
MDPQLQTFIDQCRHSLTAQPGPAGRQQVATLLQALLSDSAFVDRHISPQVSEREVLYEDPDLGFCILAHNYRSAKSSTPHDHAHSWAIYGQARGETEMSDFTLLEPATPERAGKVKAVRTYALRPGMAHVYNEGDLHAPTRVAPTSLIRIEGTNMARVKRLSYEAV